MRPVLGVSRSALGRAWTERCDPAAAQLATAIAQVHGIPDVLARVLAGRGVDVSAAPGFLAPKLRDLMPDPDVLTGMSAATERLARAVAARETVAIFGDYDVDGACSAALLAEYLGQCGVPYRIHIPDRITEGYGPNSEAIRALAAEGATLLVTVDCGTASHEPFAEAARLGLDVVVLDHHQAPEALPQALAIVNPNRQDDLSGLGHLCAAGVVFLTLVALNRRLRGQGAAPAVDLMAALDLVALATVADVVPLHGLNRAFVRQGLSVMRARGRLGLAALFDAAGLKSAPECWHLGFLVGPRINAGGRIGDAALGARLLLTADPGEASHLAARLDQLNRDRQVIEQAALEEAEAQALLALENDPAAPLLVAHGAEWHPGVVGLVAARLKERHRRPAFAFAQNGLGLATGSGRSVPGADLGRAVRAAVDAGLALKGGGHAMAAGVTVPADAIAPFAAFMAARLAEPVGESLRVDGLAIDAVISAGGARADVVQALERAGPFGQGCPEPVFALARHRLVEVSEVGTGGHIRVKLAGGDGQILGGIAFRAAGQPLGEALFASRGRPVHAAGTLSINAWGGRERVDLRVIDIAEAG